MIKEFLIGLTLIGSVSNTEGRIGIRCAGNEVVHIYKYGASASGLLYEKDIILEVNGQKGASNIMGPEGTFIHIKIKRCGEIKEFDIIRVNKKGVHD